MAKPKRYTDSSSPRTLTKELQKSKSSATPPQIDLPQLDTLGVDLSLDMKSILLEIFKRRDDRDFLWNIHTATQQVSALIKFYIDNPVESRRK